MQITIETEASKEGESSKRKVARDVDMENFTVVDEVCFCPSRQFFPNCCSQIGEVEGSKADLPDPDSTESSGEVAPLDKVIIKKREKKEDRKSTEGRDLGSSPNIETARF